MDRSASGRKADHLRIAAGPAIEHTGGRRARATSGCATARCPGATSPT